ncbi:hypothetical protein [Sphaerisporangium corydalis]|uniref:Band 7 domain-containing protein n=1 Tax=Sphaerisporangium corydalis TaxID=1441875 RepID=A0ABV9ELP0_9ACTN|nr:hypothetical protein [Sphaerisporangium corydalis]
MTLAPGDLALVRHGWFARFGHWLKSLFGPPRLPDEITVRRIDSPFSFETPALSDGFAFTVSIRLHWSATGRSDVSLLHDTIDVHREGIRWHLSDIVRRIARQYGPHLPHEAEAEINRQIKGARLFHEYDAVQLECVAYSRVGSALPVVGLQQEIWRERLARVESHEAAKVDIDRMRELRRLWRDLLAEGIDDWIAPYAVRLAEDPRNVAQTVQEMFAHRRQEAERLLTLVREIMTTQQSTNVYEFVVSSETVLRNTLTMMGIPVPDPDPESLFSGR